MPFKIALVGEAYGEDEELYKRPFIGKAGQELDRLLADAGLRREDCFITNVFNLRPTNNSIPSLCGPKADPGVLSERPPIAKGLYLKREYEAELTRLYRELEEVRPNVCVVLGNTASWALLGDTSIGRIRGACTTSPYLPWLKVLPTYHPAAILRQYDWRHVTVLDLIKAGVESEWPELRRPRREIWLDPGLEDIRKFRRDFIDSSSELSLDIETGRGQITCLGFAPTIDRALVIPFFRTKVGGNYWPTLEEELLAWKEVAEICAGPQRKVGQNGLYDIYWLWRIYGIPVLNYEDDTMLLHHALHPESEKGLGFLGSVYTNESAWKSEYGRGLGTIKRED